MMLDVFNGPLAEEIGCMSFWVYFLAIVTHVIDSMPTVRVVIVHHVTKIATELFESLTKWVRFG